MLKIIGETAFNHMGDLKKIEKLITKVEGIGLQYLTFQILHPESFSTLDYSKFSFSKQVEIDYNDWEKIYYHCIERNIEFIPCFLDCYSFNKLKHLKFNHVKIHSTDLFNQDLIDSVINYNPKNIMIETQVCNIHEIDIGLSNFNSYKGNLIIFHGFSDYPTILEDQNLNMIDFLKDRYKKQIGFADHTLSTDIIPLMAMSKGIHYLEKHITLERKEEEFDYQVSLNIDEFSTLIKNVKKYAVSLGEHIKYPVSNELKYKQIIHKKVRLVKDVKKSHKITIDSIEFVRADTGIPAGRIGSYLKQRVKNDLDKGKILEVEDLKRDKITIAIIARLKSRRLKEKVLKKIDGKPLLGILIERLKKVDYSNYNIVLATSDLKEDKPLVELAKEYNIDHYQGDPENVLNRLVCVGEKYNSSGILRVTGDNICTDIKITNLLIKEFIDTDIEYIRTNNVPLGISPEIFSMNCLYKIYDDIGNPNTSEYLTIYANKPELYRVGILTLDEKYDSFNNRFSVDTIDDFKYLESYIEYLKQKNINIADSDLNDVLNFIQRNPINEDDVLSKSFKLPNGNRITYRDFNEELNRLAKKSEKLDYRGKYE